ncbi:MAG: DUF2911 domain-containing protein [Flavobacteriaceae bacterium]|nr:DUF2911 domain-containing protein [Flavobacteriaceae bacterium]
MKKAIFVFLIFVVGATYAQLQTPQPSPSSTVEQVVGLTDFKIEYARPSAKGRKVFGDLIPYGKKWRTGANFNTLIEFSDDILFGDVEVKAGKYALFSMPKPEQWKVYLYSETENWGLPEDWEEQKVVAEVTVEWQKLEFFQETFSIGFNSITTQSANLDIMWENSLVQVPIEVPTDKKVEASINEVMSNEPKPRDYYQAAAYYYEAQKDINQAKDWIDTAMKQMEEKPFWMLRLQSLIHVASGNEKSAIKLAKASLKAAEEAGNDDYIKMNKDSLKEWGA